jgi:hypothetical protein
MELGQDRTGKCGAYTARGQKAFSKVFLRTLGNIYIIKPLKYPFANNSEGKSTPIDVAVKGDSYSCRDCGEPMITRGKDTTPRKKWQKRRHFAHKVDKYNCSTESNLHNGFRDTLCERINEAIDKRSKLSIHWECSYCNKPHTENLVRKAKLAKAESRLENTRPDITIYGADNKPICIIEIRYRHFTEQKTLEYYNDIEIPLIEFELKDATDSIRSIEEILKPNRINVCMDIKCGECGKIKRKEYLHVIESPCQSCSGPMKYYMAGTALEWLIEPEYFNIDELIFTKRLGINTRKIEQRSGNKIRCQICPKCGPIITKLPFNASLDIDNPLIISKTRGEIGYFCPSCRKLEIDQMQLARGSVIEGIIPSLPRYNSTVQQTVKKEPALDKAVNNTPRRGLWGTLIKWLMRVFR